MIVYEDGDRLTLGQLSQWSQNTVAEVKELERLGVIERDAGDLFPLPETISRMADYRERELAALKAADPRAAERAEWSALGRQLALWPEYVLKRSLRAVLRTIVRLKRGWL
jgi:hypothetical protein